MIAIKLFGYASLLTVLLTGPAQALSAPQIMSDTFSDGKLNTNVWERPTWSTEGCKETAGHLLFFSKSTNTSVEHVVGLQPKYAWKYNKGDTLSIYGTVRIPHKIPSDPGGIISNSFELGLGLFQSPTTYNYLELTVRDSLSNRQFFVYSWSTSLGNIEKTWCYAAPTNINVFKLRLTYSCATDKLGFYWAPANTMTWTKIRPALKMADLFGPSSTKIMLPYIVGYFNNIMVLREWDVWLDDFMTIYQNKPL